MDKESGVGSFPENVVAFMRDTNAVTESMLVFARTMLDRVMALEGRIAALEAADDRPR